LIAQLIALQDGSFCLPRASENARIRPGSPRRVAGPPKRACSNTKMAHLRAIKALCAEIVCFLPEKAKPASLYSSSTTFGDDEMSKTDPAASNLAATQAPTTPVACTHPKALQANTLCRLAITGEVSHG